MMMIVVVVVVVLVTTTIGSAIIFRFNLGNAVVLLIRVIQKLQ